MIGKARPEARFVSTTLIPSPPKYIYICTNVQTNFPTPINAEDAHLVQNLIIHSPGKPPSFSQNPQ